MLPPRLGGAPSALTQHNRWLLWSWVKRADAWAKMPRQCNASKSAKTNDPSTWSSFTDASDALLMADANTGVGFVLGQGIHGVDLDNVRNPATGALNDLAQEALTRLDGYAEVSPSGTGLKFFLRTNATAPYVNHDRGVEVYVGGRYFAFTGHALPGHDTWSDEVNDLSWLTGSKAAATPLSTDIVDMDTYRGPATGWDADLIRAELLPHLSVEGYGPWIEAGQALYHQFEGDEEGFELWDELSRDGDTYQGPDDLRQHWNSFSVERGVGRGPVTLRTLIKHVNNTKAALKWEVLNRLQATVAAADLKALTDTVCPEIAKAALDEVGRADIADAVKKRFTALGTKLTVREVKRLLKPLVSPYVVSRVAPWAANWVYIRADNKFFNLETKELILPQAFDFMYAHEVTSDKGDLSTAPPSKLATALFGVETLPSRVYLPTDSRSVVEVKGRRVANMYDPRSVPQVPAETSDLDRHAVELVESHLRKLFVDGESVDRFICWMAHNVQHPGAKIRWVPVIQGAEGAGKSIIGSLMALVMGHDNVTIVSTKVLASQFNGYAEGHCLAILEELRTIGPGHSKFEIKDSLKENITNPFISIHRKGKDDYVIPNVTNYLAFTNYLDAIPLDAGDRRWWVLETPFSTRADVDREMPIEYFLALAKAIREHPGALRKWLLAKEIPESFRPDAAPPTTAGKRTMIAASEDDDEWAADAVLRDGAPGVGPNCLSSAHFRQAMETLSSIPIHGSWVNKALLKAGYRPFEGTIHWNGKTVRTWCKQGFLSPTESRATTLTMIKAELDATIAEL